MTDILCISGPSEPLNGEVRVSGAKNASLPLLFATLLTPKQCVLRNVPNLEDTGVTLRILNSFGATHAYSDNTLTITTEKISQTVAPYSLVKMLRASFWLMGPLLARVGSASISLPGGDAIGTRPVDIHLDGFRKFGAEFRMSHGVVHGDAPGGLHPADITMGFPSVGATHNLLMAASLIEGESVIRNAAREPEIVDVCKFLSSMGAEIQGAGTDEIQVKGTSSPSAVEHTVIGDRIEAATYLLAGAITQGRVRVKGIDPQCMQSTLSLLQDMGCILELGSDYIQIASTSKVKGVSFDTAPFPGVATDVQPIFMAALTAAQGQSTINENVFESRFGHVAEYRRFGADISINQRTAVVAGVKDNVSLSAAPVEALDIRAAAGLVLMGLVANGVTQIRELHHLDRGYERIVDKLRNLGADITRVPSIDVVEALVGC